MKTENQKIAVLKQQAEIEMDQKNDLYGFIFDMGLLSELREFELTFDVTSPECPKRDSVAEAQRHFEIEKNIKCNLYSFIVKQGKCKELLKSGLKFPDYDITKLSTAVIARGKFLNFSKK